MSEQKPLIAGRYSLDELIGRGGMGDVYRGTDTHNGETVAIKLLHESIVDENPDIVDRFTREGEALRRLNHPSIVTIRDAVEEENRHYLIMEYVSGGSLRDLIDDQQRLPTEGVLNVALDLADALTRAHRLNIIHRDIKPDNVLLAEDGTPRLTDFGVAHMGDRTRLTQTGSVIGTYAYLSPEACNGLELDERADIWSFGVLLFEMLAGRVPFMENGTAAILTAILTKPAPDLLRLRPETPPALVNLIYRMLEKDRDRRISSIRLVGAELEAIIRNLDTPLRNMVARAGYSIDIGSRFATPSEDREGGDVPAMIRSTPRQTHGLSVYPGGQQEPATPMYTPGGTPITTSEIAQATTRKWQLIALMVIVTVLACSTVAVIALLFGPDTSEPDGNRAAATNPPSTVVPVPVGDYMVLVAQLEPLGTAPRNVDRLIADDLKLTLEEGVPYSRVGVRQYERVISNEAEARAAANETGATVIVWGTASEESIDLNVQLGVTNAFPDIALDMNMIEQVTNLRVSMDDARRESIAPQVLSVLGGLQGAAGDVYEFMRTLAVIEEIDVEPARVLGESVAAAAHRYYASYAEDTGAALDAVNEAIDKDATNPFLHALRSLALLRLGLTDSAQDAALTAARLSGEQWTVPYVLLASGDRDAYTAIQYFDRVLALRPDDWYALTSRGMMYYLLNEADTARADLEAAIALEPDANFPYVFAALQALGQGRFEDATGYIQTIIEENPDPNLYKRVMGATMGHYDSFGALTATFVNLILGRYEAAAEDAAQGLQNTGPLPDLLAMQGLARCNLERYADAEASYNLALLVGPQIGVPEQQLTFTRLLRGDVRLKQDKQAEAQADFERARADGFADPALVASFESGRIGCENLFGTAALMTSGPLSQLEMAQTPLALTPDEAAALTPVPQTQTPAAPVVAPVGPDEYMVLVAALEYVGSGDVRTRNVDRFLVDNLQETLEETVPFSNIVIRRYPLMVTSDAQAREAAEDTGAAVVVWGNYTPDLIEIEVQVGALANFPYNDFPRDTLERTANVRVHLANERIESLAPYVLNALTILQAADGDGFGSMRTAAIQDVLAVTPAQVVGNSVAAHVHRGLVAPTDASAFDSLNAAVSLDSGNALLYIFSGMNEQRRGQLAAARSDLQTARRLGPDHWTMPVLLLASMAEGLEVLQLFGEVIEQRPDDWFPLFFRGAIYYDIGDQMPNAWELARQDFDTAIALGPDANFPYIYSALLALHEGRLADAGAMIHIVLTEFPDPTFMARLIRVTFGEGFTNPYSAVLSAFVNQTLGRYTEVIETGESTLAMFPELVDLYALQAIAYCSLGDFTSAEAALSAAIRLDPDFTLAYLLRASVRLERDNPTGAEIDLRTIRSSALGSAFEPVIDTVQSGDLTCATFLGTENPILYMRAMEDMAGETPTGTPATPTPAPGDPLDTIAPVAPGHYLVLVAEPEPLDVTPRDVARFLTDDLTRRLEEDVAYSNIAVRHYPAVLTNADDAARVAQEAGATVIVWGNYTQDVVELEIQLGVTDAFPHIPFERATVDTLTNVRVHLTNERRESAALQVMGVVNLLALADGDQFEWIVGLMTIDSLDVQPAEVQGSSAAAYTHRAIISYVGDTAAAIDLFDRAITRASSNAILYAFRSLANLRLDNTAQAMMDIDTARRLGPDDWAMPFFLNAEDMTMEEALAVYQNLHALRPDDWFVYFLEAMLHYEARRDLDTAQATLDEAIANEPEANLPYIVGQMIALRQGDIPRAQAYATITLTEFPDPEITNRGFSAVYGSANQDNLTGLYFEAGTNLVLGQYASIADSVGTAMAQVFEGTTAPPGLFGETIYTMSDMFFLQGIAECNLSDYSAAESAYSQSIRFSKDFAVAYAMRAQMQQAQADREGAAKDFATARELMPDPDLAPWLDAAASGDWTCENLLDYTPALD